MKFYATLGNHDNPTQRFYQPFNMGGQRFYTFRGSAGGLGKLTQGGVRFFMLDSNYMDKAEIDWLEPRSCRRSGSDWKIAFFHHPLYSSGGAARLVAGPARRSWSPLPQGRGERGAHRTRPRSTSG